MRSWGSIPHTGGVESIPARGQHRLDPYVDRYAARTKGMTASEIRALFSVASRPEVVSLAGGMPNIAGLPLDVVGRAGARPGAASRAGGTPTPAGRPLEVGAGAARDLVIAHGAPAIQYGPGVDPQVAD